MDDAQFDKLHFGLDKSDPRQSVGGADHDEVKFVEMVLAHTRRTTIQ